MIYLVCIPWALGIDNRLITYAQVIPLHVHMYVNILHVQCSYMCDKNCVGTMTGYKLYTVQTSCNLNTHHVYMWRT